MDMEPNDLQPSPMCVNCGVALVADAIYCHRCGHKQPPPTLTLRLDESTSFVLQETERPHTIGRTIEPLEHYVDIDLGSHGGKEQGVSRFHAEISFDDKEYIWQLRDVGSQFGTFINEEQLPADEVRPLLPGQELRFGGIKLGVEIDPSQND